MKKVKILSPFGIPAKYCFFDKGFFETNPYEWQSYGLVIKRLREFIGMDQEIFGRLLQGYTRMQISRYEKEAAQPPIDFWIKMMKFFGLNINWLFTGKGLPYIEEFGDSEERKRLIKWVTLINNKTDFVNQLRGL
jgi:transcriptional regulator with XRE-family HTH domain